VTFVLPLVAVDKRLFCGLGKPTKKYLLGRCPVDLTTIRQVFFNCKARGGLPALGLRESDLRYESHSQRCLIALMSQSAAHLHVPGTLRAGSPF
jgi:hypothetical protein